MLEAFPHEGQLSRLRLSVYSGLAGRGASVQPKIGDNIICDIILYNICMIICNIIVYNIINIMKCNSVPGKVADVGLGTRGARTDLLEILLFSFCLFVLPDLLEICTPASRVIIDRLCDADERP